MSTGDPTGGSDPVTVVVARDVVPGNEVAFEEWAAGLTQAATRFDGFLGAGVLRPARAGDPWHVVYRFDSATHLAAWEGSSVRAELLDQGEQLMTTLGVHRVSGLETWFSLPGRTAPAPPRWKMFVVSSACIYLLQLAAYLALGQVVDVWVLPARLAVVVPLVTAVMTWFAMPRLTRRLAGWLYPPPTRSARNSRRAEAR